MSKWRESSSLILAAKATLSNRKYNYKIVTLQRSSRSPFMPSTFVFPGGNLCENDANPTWLDLYNDYSFQLLDLSNNVPPILQHQSPHNNNSKECLPKQISLRICAIRETFEESGILLCRSSHNNNNGTDENMWASFIDENKCLEWREKVINDPNEFLNMCSKLKLYPDVWALDLWSNWKTPPQVHSNKFDAVFFLAVLNDMPTAVHDQKEIQKIRWSTPDECIKLNHSRQILLPQPQLYEISRLRKFTDAEALLNFARARSRFGCETYWPYRIRTEDGTYSILPGDDLYPGKINEGKTETPLSTVVDLNASYVKNRIFFKEEYLGHLIIENLVPKCNHIVPATDTDYE